MSLLLCVFLYLVGAIQAAPTTNTANTTTSDSLDLKVPLSFTTRTLWSIVSSCILTLFACIYTAIHPNIPSPKDNLLRTLWWQFGLGTMIAALIAPELIVTWAMRQWLSARRVTRQFKESGYFKISQPQEQSNSKDHGSIAATTQQVEGGHGETRDLAKPFKKLFKACVLEQSEDYTWTQAHSFFVLMGGFMLYVDKKPYHTLQPDELLKLIRDGCIDVPTLTANQIHDKSKNNTISKGLTILQVTWFVLQLITRAIYHLEITQLEVGTLAFSVLSFLTYALWWDKPLNVQYPHPVYWKSTTESRLEDYAPKDFYQSDLSTWVETLRSVWISIDELLGLHNIPTHRKLRVPTFDGSIKLDRSDIMFAGLCMATIFGGIHCMAWFYAFPTYQDQVLWRISAVAITSIPCFFLVSFFTFFPLGCVFSCCCCCCAINGMMVPLCVMLYITARAILLVLMFITLYNLPPDTYKAVSWTSLVPHLQFLIIVLEIHFILL